MNEDDWKLVCCFLIVFFIGIAIGANLVKLFI